MFEAKNNYWKSLQERDAEPEFSRAAEDEFGGELPAAAVQTTRHGLADLVTRILPSSQSATEDRQSSGGDVPSTVDHWPLASSSRRDFLKAAGFTFAIATATGCSRAPLQKAIPLLNQPEQIVPGRSFFYATTCGGCSAGCGVLAKVRDGRPVKLEGNPQHALSQGGLCAVGQASILGLYDAQRLKSPIKAGADATWEVVDREIKERLEAIRARGGAVRF